MSRGRTRFGGQVSIRALCKESKLALCGYRPRCTKREHCTHAHSEEELENWRSQLLETTRVYQDHHWLLLCKSIDGTASNRYCRKVLNCEYAHSQEELDSWIEEQEIKKAELCEKLRDYVPDHHQLKLCASLKCNSPCCKNGSECMFAHSQEELDAWKGHMECRKSARKLLEMCMYASKPCKRGEECRYAHNERELQTWKEEHRIKYLQSEASIPERCTYTVPTPTCQLGTSCPYAHTAEEREELIKQLADYDKTTPRPIPRRDKLLPYTLCENHNDKRKSFEGNCIYGRCCKQAHDKFELASWEAERKAEEFPTVRFYVASECKLRLCKDMTQGAGRGVARGVARVYGRNSCGGDWCRYAHSKEELDEWTKKSCSSMVGPPDDNSDPFLTSLIDFQRRFSDELATVLHSVVMMAVRDKSLNGELGAFIDHNRLKIDPTSEEGQESASLWDIQYLLGYMQRNSAKLAGYFRMEREYLMGVVSDLMEIRNILAHGLYSREQDRDMSEKTQKFIQRGIDFVQHIVKRQEAVRNGYGDSTSDDEDYENGGHVVSDDDGDDNKDDEIQSGYAALMKLQDTFRDFLSYQRESSKRAEDYSQMNPYGKKSEALNALQAIQKLLEEETEPGPVTRFLATSLCARFRTTR